MKRDSVSAYVHLSPCTHLHTFWMYSVGLNFSKANCSKFRNFHKVLERVKFTRIKLKSKQRRKERISEAYSKHYQASKIELFPK